MSTPVLPAEEMLRELRLVKRLWPKVSENVGLGDGAEEVAALEQAIKVLTPDSEIMDRAFEKAARHILDLLVQKEPLAAMRLGSLIGLEIAAREAGKAELTRLLRESTQPAAAPSGPDKEEQ